MEKTNSPATGNVESLYKDIRQLIETAKSQVVTRVNQTLVLTYWKIGEIIRTEVLQNQRAEYGAGLLKQLAERLTAEYGTSFSHSSLTRMVKIYDYLPDSSIVATLSQQLSWSHFVELVKLEDPIKREFFCTGSTLRFYFSLIIENIFDSHILSV